MRTFYYGWVLERKSGWISSSYRLRNPISRRVFDLPNPKEKYMYHMAPKYLPSRKTLKMCFPFPNRKTGNLSFKLLTICIDDSWRALDFPSTACNITKAKLLTDIGIQDAYVIGVLPETGNNNIDAATIACLEVESEKLWSINVSKDFINDGTENVLLVNWAGKPAIARKLENALLSVWVVEDYRNQKWAEEKITIDLTDMKAARRNCTPFYFDGDKLWMHRNFESYLTFDIVSKVVAHIDAPKKRGTKFLHSNYCILEDLEGSNPLKE